MARPSVPRPRRLARTLTGFASVLALSVAILLLSTAPPAQAEPSATDLQQQIDVKARDLDRVIEQYNTLKVKLDRTKTQVSAVAAQVATLRQQADQARDQVGTLAANAYKGGAIGQFSALLNADSPAELISRMETLNALSHRQQRDIDRLTTASTTLTDKKANLDTLLVAQSAQQAKLTSQKSSIEKQLTDLKRQQASLGPRVSSDGSVSVPPPYVAGRAKKVVDYAYAQLGKPYVFGAAGPDAFDCSGLTLMAWAQVGVQLDHASHVQMDEQTTPIPRSQLQPGDLVFFYGGEHVGIYIGSNSVIHAPQPGEVVKISTIDWMGGYSGAGRPG